MNQADATDLVNTIFESLGPFLVRYAFSRTRSTELAEDVVQEAFLALYRDLRLGKNIQDPKLWTIGAVRNQIRKHARNTQRHGEDLMPTEAFDLVPASQEQTGFRWEEQEGAPLILSVLTPREEEVVLLRLQSMKYREIAQQLGIGTKSVCTLLARAVKKLQTVSRSVRSGERREVPNALQ